MTGTRANMPSVKLYMKPGCHLCDEAEAMLDNLRPRYAHALERIDINTDPELRQRYAELIPVVVLGELESPAPLTRATLEHALERATHATSDSGTNATTQAQAPPTTEIRPKARRLPWSNSRGR